MEAGVVDPQVGVEEQCRHLWRWLVVALAVCAVAAAGLMWELGRGGSGHPGWWVAFAVWMAVSTWCSQRITALERAVDATTKRRIERTKGICIALLVGAVIVLHGWLTLWWVVAAVCGVVFGVPLAAASRMAWPRSS